MGYEINPQLAEKQAADFCFAQVSSSPPSICCTANDRYSSFSYFCRGFRAIKADQPR
jgi:hypothetical protein